VGADDPGVQSQRRDEAGRWRRNRPDEPAPHISEPKTMSGSPMGRGDAPCVRQASPTRADCTRSWPNSPCVRRKQRGDRQPANLTFQDVQDRKIGHASACSEFCSGIVGDGRGLLAAGGAQRAKRRVGMSLLNVESPGLCSGLLIYACMLLRSACFAAASNSRSRSQSDSADSVMTRRVPAADSRGPLPAFRNLL
jgi:hypothetical protein